MKEVSRRNFLLGIGSALGVVGLAACSSDGGADTATATQTEKATEEAEAVMAEQTTTEDAAAAEQGIQPIDPPIISELAWRTYQISEYGMDSLFWIEGDDRAILLDTGTGVFDIPSFIAANFGDKPYDVVLTHGHVDHAGGMFQFDRVFLNEADYELALGNTVEERQDYVNIMLAQSGGIYALSPDMVVGGEDTEADAPEFLPLNEGDVFDLGGRTLEVYFTPGHTAGSCSLLDRKNRILFSGDACNQNTLLTPFGGAGEDECSDDQCVSGLKRSAEKMWELREDFDRNVNGHVGYARWLTLVSQKPEVIPECIELCQDILDGKVVGEEQVGIGGNTNLVAKSKTGVMQIQYMPWQVK